MRYCLLLSVILPLSFIGCTQKQEPTKPAPDLAAGKAIAEAKCSGCHGLNGGGAAPGIPHLAAQSPEYLLQSLYAYKEGIRHHAGLQDLAAHMSDTDLRNVAGYFASQPPIQNKEMQELPPSPYEKGKTAAAVCASCHGEDGNSTTPGIPTLAGQQPVYVVTATQEYLHGLRPISGMEPTLRGLRKLDLQNIALYFAVQTPVQRGAAPFGDAAAGEPLSGKCGGCHGARGVSNDAATPSLASQDPQYLLSAIKAYRDQARHHEIMNAQLAGTSDSDIENIVAFYTVQKPKAAEDRPISAKKLAEKCDRCHGAVVGRPTMTIPKIAGQDKDYLMMALRAYHDGKRGTSTMHRMTMPYTDTIIEDVASYYASQPAK